jgi:xanthine dehydrogenase YagS FAD-binding subunit
MDPFLYERADSVAEALRLHGAGATFIAGGTELVNLMKERIATPAVVVDINRLPLSGIAFDGTTLRLGALARMSDVAGHEAVRAHFPAISIALEKSASAQLRNAASMGGNLLQRTRCAYFRADQPLPCNKRTPGSGCAALRGANRLHAIFGWSDACVATHPSDVAVALAMLGASVQLVAKDGTERSVTLDEFYRLPGDRPELDTTVRAGELIVAITVPASAAARNSTYLKVRERASYEFALVSAAVAAEHDAGVIRQARIALGGVAAKPWRLEEAERALVGQPFTARAVRAALAGDFRAARPLAQNAFKIELAQRAVVRAMTMIGAAV